MSKNKGPTIKTEPTAVPRWGLKAIYRLAQKMNKPGIYPLTLIVTKDGRRQLVLEGGKIEELGR